MIYALEIDWKDMDTFYKFMLTDCPLGDVDIKVFDNKHSIRSDYTVRLGDIIVRQKLYNKLVLFRDKPTCEMIEMSWLMMKDEIKDRRPEVSLAA